MVIGTGGTRPQRLRRTLEALAAQELPAGGLEVVVVGNHGTQAPESPAGLTVRFIEAPAGPQGAAKNRNLGWRETRAPLVAVTDDDCRPAPRWTAALLVAAERSPGAFFQGRTEPDPEEVHMLWGLARSHHIVGDSPWHETCNMAYPRELLERLGGFDESYLGAGGEDTDLALRAFELGARKAYVDDALVWHAVHARNFRQTIRDGFRLPETPQVLARHPQQRQVLPFGIFYRAHGQLLLALAGVLTRRPLLALLMSAPYLEVHYRRHRHTPLSLVRATTHLPVRVLADLAEMATIAVRAVRSRAVAL